MAKRHKKYDDDDGRTIVDMNVEGMPWYQPRSGKDVNVDPDDKPTRKERRSMVFGAFLAYLPAFLTFLLGFVAVFLLLYVWFGGWK